MPNIKICPCCKHYLSFDNKSKEYYCLVCDYTEEEKWKFKNVYRKVQDD